MYLGSEVKAMHIMEERRKVLEERGTVMEEKALEERGTVIWIRRIIYGRVRDS